MIVRAEGAHCIKEPSVEVTGNALIGNSVTALYGGKGRHLLVMKYHENPPSNYKTITTLPIVLP